MDIYNYLLDNGIFNIVYDDLEIYKKKIINKEREITNKTKVSEFLNSLLTKINYKTSREISLPLNI